MVSSSGCIVNDTENIILSNTNAYSAFILLWPSTLSWKDQVLQVQKHCCVWSVTSCASNGLDTCNFRVAEHRLYIWMELICMFAKNKWNHKHVAKFYKLQTHWDFDLLIWKRVSISTVKRNWSFWCPQCGVSTHRDHHQDPPGRSHRRHQAHTESVLYLDLSEVKLFSYWKKGICSVKISKQVMNDEK